MHQMFSNDNRAHNFKFVFSAIFALVTDFPSFSSHHHHGREKQRTSKTLKMADGSEYFVCQCFFTHNIFLKNFGLHVTFESEEQFILEYKKVNCLLSNL